MSKFTVKTNLSNVKKEGNDFTYNQEIVSMHWTTNDGPWEVMPDYSYRKTYQLGYGNESPSPALKRYLSEWINAPYDGRTVSPPPNGLEEGEQAEAYHNKSASDSESLYGPHWDKPIKRSRTKPLTKEELEYRHEKLKRFMDPDFGPDQLKDTQEN